MSYEVIGKGIVKRTHRRALGLFIDGTGLDRATRRLNRRVDMAALVRGVTSGLHPVVARYYTIIPFEDDSRHRAFLDAVARAGLTVVVKRLPPKGVMRQVTTDPEMAADIVAFSLGHTRFSSKNEWGVAADEPHEDLDHSTESNHLPSPGPALSLGLKLGRRAPPPSGPPRKEEARKEGEHAHPNGALPSSDATHGGGDSSIVAPLLEIVKPENRVVTVVCPTRDLAYPISLAKEIGVDTVTADFGQFNAGDVLKSAAKWIDLSDSETIWRE